MAHPAGARLALTATALLVGGGLLFGLAGPAPAAGFVGTDSFTYIATGAGGTSDPRP